MKRDSRGSVLGAIDICTVKHDADDLGSLYLCLESVAVVVKLAPGCQTDLKSSLMIGAMSRLQTVAHAKICEQLLPDAAMDSLLWSPATHPLSGAHSPD